MLVGTRTVRRRRSILVLAVLAALAAGAGVLVPGIAPGWTGPAGGGDALSLTVLDERTPVPDYRRDAFGAAWADIDGNGCAQRQDVLARDLRDITRDGCTVLTGVLDDPYTGTEIRFRHDRVAAPGEPGSTAVQIDHVVSLAAAWRGGASTWTDAERERFANSLENLLAVDGAANQAKGSKGPAAWLPPDPGAHCAYADRYVGIALRWRIAVPATDRDALAAVLAGCDADGRGRVDR